MNKQQFMFTLRQNLAPLGQSTVQEILADFDDHFRNGLEAGQSEDEIANELGNPAEIARQYLDESADFLTVVSPAAQPVASPADGPTAYASTVVQPGFPATSSAQQATASSVQPTAKPNHDGALIAVILLNIFVGVPIWIALFATLSGFWAAAAGIGVTACVLFALAIFETGITSLILVLFGLAQTALTVLAIILMVYLTKWLINGLRAYVRWNRKLVRGGETA